MNREHPHGEESAEDAAPADPLHEQLTAYLDGELAPEERVALEALLERDPSARDELRRLRLSWDALDDLPTGDVSAEFAQSTIEMVALEARDEVARMTAALPTQRRRSHVAAVAIAAAALLVGFAGARWAANEPHRRMLASLPAVMQVDALGQYQDVAFLERLEAEAGEMLAGEAPAGFDDEADAWFVMQGASFRERGAWFETQTDKQQAELRERAARLAGLTPQKRESLLGNAASLAAHERAESLLRTLLSYQNWLSHQSAAEQATLRRLGADERVRRVERELRNERRESLYRLTPEEAAKLREAVERLAATPAGRGLVERFDRFESRDLPPEVRRRLGEMREGLESDPLAAVIALSFASDRLREWPLQFFVTPDAARELRDDWRTIEPELLAVLPERSRRWVESTPEADRRTERLRRVLVALKESDVPADVKSFFANELSDGEVQELLTLPADEMLRQLDQRRQEREFDGLDLERMMRAPRWRRGPSGRGGDGFRGGRRGPPRDDGRQRRGEGPPSGGPPPERPGGEVSL
ncbi:hypothetical protein Mal64_15310 [Pseudobythopirellula maris]|uniref:Zinc-finger domain-containing protein n=1 Tax=Pseudobythopirellula maris TaxID=2527991 RepID=A0A5C5ZUC6_9BACT|nr:hypothetical protein [Pseudobythopirellula maris]TWT91132.1 hypothetical protein Mal64_15310 [Pseudobythopirellula maris]